LIEAVCLAADESFGKFAQSRPSALLIENGNGVGGTPFPIYRLKQPVELFQ